ncbi:MAG: universal stress protein [Dehalococcoidia bacterium]|nr:universal stress protein [Dehalococcoidia bacterium]
MFKILVATDGSGYAFQAIDYVRNLAERIADCEITLVNVADTTSLPVSLASTNLPETGWVTVDVERGIEALIKQMEAESNKILEDSRSKLLAIEKPVYLISLKGSPWKMICDLAEKENFDLLVMGSRGRGRVAGLLMGSISEKVLHCSTSPVLIIRGQKE